MSQCHDTYATDPLDVPHLPLRVSDMMTKAPVTVEPTATIKEIAATLLHHDIRAVPVLDLGDKLVGVVSEADILCRECPTSHHHTLGMFVTELLGAGHRAGRDDGLTAGEIMSSRLVTCSPDETVPVAARRMLLEDVRMMPVLRDGKMVGVISRHDVLRAFVRPDSEVRDRIARLLSSPKWAPDGHRASAEVVDGVVRLTGSVRFPSDAAVIAALVGEIPGVVEVVDHMTAEQPEPHPEFLSDTAWR